MTEIAIVEVTVQPAIKVVEVALPGIQGPAGAEGGDTLSRIASGAISALKVVSAVSGAVALTDPASLASVETVEGVATGAAANGETVQIRASGRMIDGSFPWSAGTPLFIGATGGITATPPSTVAIRQIGMAIAPGEILISIDPIIIL